MPKRWSISAIAPSCVHERAALATRRRAIFRASSALYRFAGRAWLSASRCHGHDDEAVRRPRIGVVNVTAREALRFAAGILLLLALSALPGSLLIGETTRLLLSAENAWLRLAWLFVLGGGLAATVVLLRRRIPMGYLLWAQGVLSLAAFGAYYGFLRREDSFRCCRNPDDPDFLAPAASWEGVAGLTLVALALGYLPLALRAVLLRVRARGSGSGNGGPG